MKNRGIFISFEGPEASGKSSQIILLKKYFKSKQIPFIITREPGGTKLGEKLRNLILNNKSNLKKLEKIIHPLVRKKMKKFTLDNKSKKILFYEIPLLIESKLMRFFNVVIFIKSKKQLRFKRFKLKKGNKTLFNLLNSKQMSDRKKIRFCHHVVVNEKNLKFLKSKLLSIISKYE